jgi:Alkylmercury lyase
MNHASLHEVIIASFLTHERPPTIRELADHFRRDEQDVRQALRALADYHGVVLHPKSDEIWVAHPFSAAPTTCVVRAGSRTWWGNCAWCSLGLAHLAGGTAVIETRLGGLADSVAIRIEHGRLLDSEFVVHFPIPMREAWDNVIYTCSTMLLFRDGAQVSQWCTTRGIPKGDVRPIDQVWRFAVEWYARHADANWTKWSTREASEIFSRHQLTGPIWELSDETVRF